MIFEEFYHHKMRDLLISTICRKRNGGIHLIESQKTDISYTYEILFERNYEELTAMLTV
jgi:hypothetical protein